MAEGQRLTAPAGRSMGANFDPAEPLNIDDYEPPHEQAWLLLIPHPHPSHNLAHAPARDSGPLEPSAAGPSKPASRFRLCSRAREPKHSRDATGHWSLLEPDSGRAGPPHHHQHTHPVFPTTTALSQSLLWVPARAAPPAQA
jgi:hypothetical protein